MAGDREPDIGRLHLGWGGELVAELGTLVAEHPLREPFWGQLMLALYRAGRQGEALEAYRTACRIAADQLGVDLGIDLRRLHVAILRQDPSLDPPMAGHTDRRCHRSGSHRTHPRPPGAVVAGTVPFGRAGHTGLR